MDLGDPNQASPLIGFVAFGLTLLSSGVKSTGRVLLAESIQAAATAMILGWGTWWIVRQQR
ncbi:MAG TPA: hypothetical protein VK726_27100 [Acetobacteraceae bacterium]|jgi:hypothetical protein|nr:hypothetical protein [Acetobacteraceae bacterium]